MGCSICPGQYFFLRMCKPHTYRTDAVVSGLHLADESLWLSAVASLTVFDITKMVENGIEITPEIDPSSHGIRYVFGSLYMS